METTKRIITRPARQKKFAKTISLRDLRMQELDVEFKKQSKKLASIVTRFKKTDKIK